MRAKIGGDVGDVVNQEVRQQISAMQVGPVPDQRGAQRLVPEPCHQRAHQQRLHHRHLIVRWHLEAAQLQQAQPAASTVGAVELVDAELGAVRISGDVGQQVPQRPVGDPRLGGTRRPAGKGSEPRDLRERDLQLVERLGTALIDPRRLRSGADEPAGEQVGKRRMALPIGQQRHQQVWAAQQRRVVGRGAAQRDVVAAARAAVGAVDVERLCRQSGQPRFPVQRFQHLLLVNEARRRRDVDLDDAGVGGDGHRRQARVGRWSVALDDNRTVGLGGGGLDPADQVDEMFQFLGGRHVDVEQPIADLGHHRGGGRRIGILDHRGLRLDVRLGIAGQVAPAGQRVGIVRRSRRMPTDRVQRQPQTGR